MRSSCNPPSYGRAWETYKDMFRWGIEPDVMVYTTLMKVSYDRSLCSSDPKILTRFAIAGRNRSRSAIVLRLRARSRDRRDVDAEAKTIVITHES